LARHPEAFKGRPDRAQKLVSLLQTGDLAAATNEFYNALEAPALNKYPLLALFQEFLKANGAAAALMSGSGSTTFALARGQNAAEQLRENFRAKFGETHWTAVVSL
jgi:4-diphosphocytidyl-2C-methyl-D-erythritol kinase